MKSARHLFLGSEIRSEIAAGSRVITFVFFAQRQRSRVISFRGEAFGEFAHFGVLRWRQRIFTELRFRSLKGRKSMSSRQEMKSPEHGYISYGVRNLIVCVYITWKFFISFFPQKVVKLMHFREILTFLTFLSWLLLSLSWNVVRRFALARTLLIRSMNPENKIQSIAWNVQRKICEPLHFYNSDICSEFLLQRKWRKSNF